MFFLPTTIISIFCVIFFIFVMVIKSHIKHTNNMRNKIEDFSETVFDNVTQKIFGERFKEKPEDITCEYCGALISADSKKCPNCSASVKKKK